MGRIGSAPASKRWAKTPPLPKARTSRRVAGLRVLTLPSARPGGVIATSSPASWATTIRPCWLGSLLGILVLAAPRIRAWMTGSTAMLPQRFRHPGPTWGSGATSRAAPPSSSDRRLTQHHLGSRLRRCTESTDGHCRVVSEQRDHDHRRILVGGSLHYAGCRTIHRCDGAVVP